MKQFFLLCLFALIGTVGLQAQAKKSCAATCSKAKMAACSAKGGEKVAAAQLRLGSVDDERAAGAAKRAGNVERRVDLEAKTVSYVRKDVCATSGQVSYADVEYCTKSKQFINVSPTAVAGAKAACCSKGAAGQCADKSQGAKAKLVKE